MKRWIMTALFSTISTAAVKAGETCSAPRIVLVHGIFQQGHSFLFLKRKLEKQGYDCLVPSLQPRDARTGLEPLAAQLQKEIEQRWGKDATFHMVAHSMGGLVSRYYLQELGGHRRCKSLVTMGTPHQGTHAAFLYPGKGAQQMRPHSDFLTKLDASAHRLKDLPLFSYRTPLDLIILPSSSSIWPLAENHRVWALAHPLVVHSPRVHRKVLEGARS